MIYWQLYWVFVKVGLFCIGGGYASMPLIEAQVVYQQQWITMKEFVDIFTISQMTPGPIGINAATFVGSKIAGIGGEYWTKYDVPDDVEYGFVIVAPAQGDNETE